MKHLSEEELILYQYGEVLDRAGVEAHLAECERCRAQRAALDSVLKVVGSFPIPDRPDDYGLEVWQRLALQLRSGTARRETNVPAPRFNWPRWRFGVAAGALVALAFIAGRFWPRHSSSVPQAISQQARKRVLMAAVADHFERAEILLTALEHAGDEGGRKRFDISFERELAEQLVTWNQLYEASAVRDGQTSLARVLDELGRVLVTISNAPATVSPGELAALRETVQQEGILFKVQVVGSRLRDNTRAQSEAGQLVD